MQKVTKQNKPFGKKKIDAYLMDQTGKMAIYRSATKDKLAGILVRQAEAVFASKNRG